MDKNGAASVSTGQAIDRAYQVSARAARNIAVGRFLGGLMIAVLAVAGPFDLSPLTTIVFVILGLVVLPAEGYLFIRNAEREGSYFWLAVGDIVLAALATSMIYTAPEAGIMAIGATVTIAIPIQSRRRLLALTIIGAIAVSLVGYFHDIKLWVLLPATLALVVLGFEPLFGEARARQQEREVRYQALIEASAVFFWEIDGRTSTFTRVVGNCVELLGYTPEDLVGRYWRSVVVVSDEDIETNLSALADNEVSLTTPVILADGSRRQFRHTIRLAEKGRLLRGVSTDITELAEATEIIRHQAEHDNLTGLQNRLVLIRELERMAQEDRSGALIMLDLDRFKEVNDTLGHPVGDRLLQQIADRLASELPDAHLVARLGGDEFAILMTGPVSRRRAADLAVRIHQICERKTDVEGFNLVITPSIGVALIPEHGRVVDQVLRHADIAMYQAKRAGQRFRVFDGSPSEMSVERLTLGSEVASAITNRQLELWYQPKLELASGRLVGFEGLARWRHPERGILPPIEFLELIAISGERHRFALLTLELGIEFAQQLAQRGHGTVHVALNLSPDSFLDDELPIWLSAKLAAADVTPESLILEITESGFSADGGQPIRTFERMAQLGTGLSIDDFGTGYSSLTRLRDFPVTEVKLDRSFVGEMRNRPESMAIVRTVLELADVLGLETVAEGVEDPETAELLASMGCDMAQGYLYAKPMPLVDALAFADQWDRAEAAESAPYSFGT